MTSWYQELNVRKKSIILIEKIYKITIDFPKTEIYALTDQMKRSSISIASNIAEWDQRNTNKENINFLYIAKWSAAELETQIIIAKRLWFIDENNLKDLQKDTVEILKMLSSLIKFKRTNP